VFGVQVGVLFEEKTSRIESGDIIALYTDGITEAENESGELFGRARLAELIAEWRDDSPDTIATAIFNTLTAFVDSRQFADDITLVIIKID
jgi:sigma-B regulation protein RsbU (phosphoserine phosphatase)